MNNTLKRAFAAVAISSSLVLSGAALADEPSITDTSSDTSIELAQNEARSLNYYLFRASDANPLTVSYHQQFLQNLFQGISMLHVEKPSLQEVEKLAREGIKELRDSQASYTMDELVEAALDGVLNTLDPHSDYMNKEQWKMMSERTSGQFGGLGIQVGMDEQKGVEVVAPMKDTPAERAGLQAGDFITEIDGVSMIGKKLEDAIELMRGKVGDPVDITIMRPGEVDPIKLTLVREIIRSSSVHSEAIGDIGYVRITSFSDLTTADLEKAVKELQDDIGQSLKGIVLDLRFNPGGLLPEAIGVTDSFLESGGIVSTGDAKGNGTQRSMVNARPGDITNGAPVVVLINGGSASASEIVAGALQDNGRATVMGTQSFGKGSVQSVIPFGQIFPSVTGSPREDAMKITTQLYYTPSGDTIQGKGVTPDVRTEFAGTASDGDIGTSEAQLGGTISNPETAQDQATTTATCSASGIAADTDTLDESLVLQLRDGTAEPDYQLLCAIEHLRGTPEYTEIKALPAPAP